MTFSCSKGAKDFFEKEEGGDILKEGFLFALIAALLWGLAPIVEKIGLAKLSPLAGLTLRSLGITVALLIFSLFKPTWKEIGQADLRSVVFILIGGLIAGLVAQWLYYGALKHMPASTVAPIVGSYPFFAFVLGVLLLGETISWTKGLGALLILGGLILMKV